MAVVVVVVVVFIASLTKASRRDTIKISYMAMEYHTNLRFWGFFEVEHNNARFYIA